MVHFQSWKLALESDLRLKNEAMRLNLNLTALRLDLVKSLNSQSGDRPYMATKHKMLIIMPLRLKDKIFAK